MSPYKCCEIIIIVYRNLCLSFSIFLEFCRHLCCVPSVQQVAATSTDSSVQPLKTDYFAPAVFVNLFLDKNFKKMPSLQPLRPLGIILPREMTDGLKTSTALVVYGRLATTERTCTCTCILCMVHCVCTVCVHGYYTVLHQSFLLQGHGLKFSLDLRSVILASGPIN